MKKIFLFSILTVIFQVGFAQNTIKGSIVNETTQEPVVGAAVKVKDTYNATTTDAAGNFSLTTKKESATLLVSHLSFESKKVEATTTGELKISLQPKTFLADEVIVSATRANKTTSTS